MEINNINMKDKMVFVCLLLLGITCLGILVNDDREVNKLSFKLCEEYAEADKVTILLPSKEILIEDTKTNYEELFKSCEVKK